MPQVIAVLLNVTVYNRNNQALLGYAVYSVQVRLSFVVPVVHSFINRIWFQCDQNLAFYVIHNYKDRPILEGKQYAQLVIKTVSLRQDGKGKPSDTREWSFWVIKDQATIMVWFLLFFW